MVIAGHPGVNAPPDPIDEPDQGRTSRRHGLADLTRGLTLHTYSADSIACFGVIDRRIDRHVEPNRPPVISTKGARCSANRGLPQEPVPQWMGATRAS